MISAYIIEDEPQAITLIKSYLEASDWIQCVGATRYPMSGLEYLSAHDVDVLFLDINMPQLSGLDLYSRLHEKPHVVFTTAYTQYASTAFDIDAVDYLVKPITAKRFAQACHKLRLRLGMDSTPSSDEKHTKKESLFIKSGTTIHHLDWREITYIQRDENYICIHLTDKKILVRRSLTSLESSFPDYFVRVHKSYAVSLLHTAEIISQGVLVAERMIPVGRSYRAATFEKFEERS